MTALGYKAVLDKTRAGKLARSEPFLIALQEGKVYIVNGVFSKADYNELESFDGAKNAGQHDDIIDAISSAFNILKSNNLIPTIRINQKALTKMNLGGRTLL